MILRLWALAWAARYLKSVPILGWRFSDTIGQKLEARMDRDVDVGEVTVEFDDGSPPSDLYVRISITNELPVDLTIAAVNLRIGYTADARTIVNLLWSNDAHGGPPTNVTHSLIESDETDHVCVERYLPYDAPCDSLTVDGTLTTRAWLDVPTTKRIPLGTLDREIDSTTVTIPS